MQQQLATFKLDNRLYGVDVSRVQEALRVQQRTAVPGAPRTVSGLVNLRGQVVLMVDLRARLGREPYGPDDEPMMVVVKVDGEPVSLLVDQVGDVLDLDTDQCGPPPPTLEAALRDVVTGVYSMEDGLLLLLDVDLAARV
jgi:purine-binding chemotaxis protein CheW